MKRGKEVYLGWNVFIVSRWRFTHHSKTWNTHNQYRKNHNHKNLVVNHTLALLVCPF